MPGSDHTKPASDGVKLTYDDLLALPDDGLRHELIDGEHFVTAAPNLRHQRVVGDLHYRLRGWLETHPLGEVFLAPFDVKFDNLNVVEPDLAYLSHARAEQISTPERFIGAPDLVIEVASPSTRRRDETIKKRLYEREGVSEYWFVDPEIDVVRVYRRAGTAFGPVEELALDGDEVLRTPLLPGLDLRLADIFRT